MTEFPPSETSCGTCRHWWPENDRTDVGECRRYPPTVLSHQGSPHDIAQRTVFPVLAYVMGCGEWTEDTRS